MDNKTTISQIRKWCRKVRSERDWHPSAKDLAISLSLEVSELLEHFQWGSSEKIEERIKKDKDKKEEIEMEIGDIINYLCEVADRLDIDMTDSLKRKLKKVEEKYPVDKLKKHGSKFYFAQKKKYREKN